LGSSILIQKKIFNLRKLKNKSLELQGTPFALIRVSVEHTPSDLASNAHDFAAETLSPKSFIPSVSRNCSSFLFFCLLVPRFAARSLRASERVRKEEIKTSDSSYACWSWAAVPYQGLVLASIQTQRIHSPHNLSSQLQDRRLCGYQGEWRGA
jgi:hypothetical protein